MNMNYCCAFLGPAKPAFHIMDDHPCQSIVLAFPPSHGDCSVYVKCLKDTLVKNH